MKDRNGRAVLEFAVTPDIGCLSQLALIVRYPSAAQMFDRLVTADDCRAVAELIRAAIARSGG